MNWLCREAVGHCGVAPTGLKLVGGPHWKPATKNVSPEAPGRPFAPPVPALLPVCAVPQAVAPRPIRLPPTARPATERKRRRLGVQAEAGEVTGATGSSSGLVIKILPENASLLGREVLGSGGTGSSDWRGK